MPVLLPYSFKLLSRRMVGASTLVLQIQVLDAGLSVRKDVEVHLPAAAGWSDIRAAIEGQIDQALLADAGSYEAYLDQLITESRTFHGTEIVGVRKKLDQAVTATSFANCTDLLFALEPNRHYKFSFIGAYTAALATTGLQLSVNGPASPAFLAFVGQIHTAAAAVFGGVGGAYDVAIAATASGGATPLPFRIEGSISTGPAGGALQLRMRSEVNASAVTILRGSVGELIAVG